VTFTLPPELAPSFPPAARHVAEAAMDVIANRGYEGLSVRAVAAEAGLTGGAVQHHFRTRAALLEAAFQQTVSAIADRMAGAEGDAGTRALLLRIGVEALPLDERRRREGTVWLVLSAAAATDPRLAVLHRAAVGAVVEALTGLLAGEAHLRASPSSSARTFAAVLDGLTLQGVTGAQEPRAVEATLRDCVDSLWDR
jgi:AcrR family transcriptional regulator